MKVADVVFGGLGAKVNVADVDLECLEPTLAQQTWFVWLEPK